MKTQFLFVASAAVALAASCATTHGDSVRKAEEARADDVSTLQKKRDDMVIAQQKEAIDKKRNDVEDLSKMQASERTKLADADAKVAKAKADMAASRMAFDTDSRNRIDKVDRAVQGTRDRMANMNADQQANAQKSIDDVLRERSQVLADVDSLKALPDEAWAKRRDDVSKELDRLQSNADTALSKVK